MHISVAVDEQQLQRREACNSLVTATSRVAHSTCAVVTRVYKRVRPRDAAAGGVTVRVWRGPRSRGHAVVGSMLPMQCKRSERRAATSPFAFFERSTLRHRWQARSFAQVDSRLRGVYCKGIAMAAASVDKGMVALAEHNNGPCVAPSGLQR